MKNKFSLKDKINYKIWKHFNKKMLSGNAKYEDKIGGGIENKIISVPYEKPRSTYKCLISNIGCGFSGSGTIIDFMREFSNTTVHGFFSAERIGDEEKVVKLKKLKTQTEVDFFFCIRQSF